VVAVIATIGMLEATVVDIASLDSKMSGTRPDQITVVGTSRVPSTTSSKLVIRAQSSTSIGADSLSFIECLGMVTTVHAHIRLCPNRASGVLHPAE
jgi:hypothetical protein